MRFPLRLDANAAARLTDALKEGYWLVVHGTEARPVTWLATLVLPEGGPAYALTYRGRLNRTLETLADVRRGETGKFWRHGAALPFVRGPDEYLHEHGFHGTYRDGVRLATGGGTYTAHAPSLYAALRLLRERVPTATTGGVQGASPTSSR